MISLALEAVRTGYHIAGRTPLRMFHAGIVPDKFQDGRQRQQIRGEQIIVPVNGILLFYAFHALIIGKLLIANCSSPNECRGHAAGDDQADSQRGHDDFKAARPWRLLPLRKQPFSQSGYEHKNLGMILD